MLVVFIGYQFLFRAYKQIVEGEGLLWLFAASKKVFIPKSATVDDQGRIVRSLDAPRQVTLCRCVDKILTTAICSGLHQHSVNCIHPQRCVSTRQMTDNIFEIETSTLAHCTCMPHNSGILY